MTAALTRYFVEWLMAGTKAGSGPEFINRKSLLYNGLHDSQTLQFVVKPYNLATVLLAKTLSRMNLDGSPLTCKET